MARTRIKICGLTREEDIAVAIDAGVDALGFVFAPLSSRKLDVDKAKLLVEKVPAFVDRVGLFQDQEAENVASILDQVPLTLLQFHGNEPVSFCNQFGMPYIKAVRMAEEDALVHVESEFDDAAGLLLDSHQAGKAGGTGKVFDWSRIRQSKMPLIIAGGLDPSNVFEVVRRFEPWAVDVSSGVEAAPGLKDESLVRDFVAEVERGNSLRD